MNSEIPFEPTTDLGIRLGMEKVTTIKVGDRVGVTS